MQGAVSPQSLLRNSDKSVEELEYTILIVQPEEEA